jgi:GTP-binding protein YchF
MGLSCGIVGLPNIGKTTLFCAITGTEQERSNYMFSTTAPFKGVVDVPDPRLARIREHIPSSKLVYAQMAVTDIPGLVSGSSTGEGMGVGFLSAIKESDALLHVVRCFEKEGIQHVSGKVDPAFDAEVVEMELAAVDKETVARNLDRVQKKAKSGLDKEAQLQIATFEKAKVQLESGAPLRMVEWSEAERKALFPLFLMTIKPVLFVANVGDDDLAGQGKHVQALREYAARTKAHVLHLCCDLEAELLRMGEEDRKVFMADMGLVESGLARLIHSAFDLLGLQTYFTAGEKEIRAWVIHKGDNAVTGAGVIHTDFLKKFVRAQIYTFDDLTELHSEAAIKSAGKMRLEGKEYVLRDGDICNFLIAN